MIGQAHASSDKSHDCVFFIHGDDIVACDEHDVLQWLQEEISKRYLTKVRVCWARSRRREIDRDPQLGA